MTHLPHRHPGRRALLAGACALAATQPAMLFADAPARLVFITPQRFLIAFAPVLIGATGGYFKAQGLEVSVLGGASSPQALQQVLSGQAQVGRTAGVTLLAAVAKGAPCRSFSTIAHGSPFYVISAKANPVRGPKDFVGGVIGVISQGGPSDVTLDAMLLSANIDPKTVQRQPTGDNAGAFGLVQTGRIRAFIGSFDTLRRAQAAGADLVSFNTQDYMPLPGQVYAATDDTIAQHPDLLAAFLKGVKSAIDSIVADKDGTATLAALRRFDVEGLDDPASAAAILHANQDLWLSAGPNNLLRNVPENWARGVALAVRAGISPDVPADKLFTNAIVERALGTPS